MGDQNIMKASIPQDSATVILVRDVANSQYEIFLMRRCEEQNFLGGAHVFPGGRMDKEDCATELASHATGVSQAVEKLKTHEPELPEEKLRGLYFAAIREMFEEAGIMLAYNPSGGIINFPENDPELEERFNRYRFELYEKKITLIDIAKRENISYALDLLTPYAHWITPEASLSDMRFDARFFIATIPQGQEPLHDNIEMTESLWATPRAALDMASAGAIRLILPTIVNIEELSDFKSTEELFASISNRKIDTILPQAYKVENGYGVMLPHDPDYSIAEYKQKPRPKDTCRYIVRNGKWESGCFE